MGADANEAAFLVGDWLVEPELNRIVRGEETVKIDPRNMRLLQLLASRARQVVTQKEIEETVWSDVVVTPNSVYQSIAQLRRALRDEKANPRYIETIARKGYRLIADIRVPTGQVEDVGPSNAAALIDVVPERKTTTVAVRSSIIVGVGLGCAAILAVIAIKDDGGPPPPSNRSAAPLEDRPAFKYASSTAPESPHIRSNMLEELSIVANNDGRPHEALAYAKQAVEFERRISGNKSPETAAKLTTLAVAYHWLAQYGRAEETAREAVSIFQSIEGLQPERLDAFDTLGTILIDLGQFAEANAHIQQAIELSDQLYGSTSGQAACARINLVILYNAAGSYEKAEKEARQLLLNEPISRSYRTYEVTIRVELAASLLQQGRYQEAAQETDATLNLIRRFLRTDHPFAASAYEILGNSLIGLHDYQQAEHVLRRAMRIWHQNGGWTWRVGRSASALGEALLGQGRIQEAEKYFTYASRALANIPNGQSELRAIRDHESRMQQLKIAREEQRSGSDARVAELSEL